MLNNVNMQSVKMIAINSVRISRIDSLVGKVETKHWMNGKFATQVTALLYILTFIAVFLRSTLLQNFKQKGGLGLTPPLAMPVTIQAFFSNWHL